MKIRATAVTMTAVCAAALVLSGCTSGGGESTDGDAITFWVQEDLPDRVAATEAIVDDFSEESGIEVEVVSVAEDQFSQLITSAAAAGDLPDVIGGISLPQVRTLSANELVDTDAVAAVIDSLDASTFSEKALELTADGDTQLAVPSESWLQMLFYRTDLFDAAGLDAPRELRRDARGRSGAEYGRRGRLRRRNGAGRRVHRADVRAGRTGQRLPAGRLGRRDRTRLARSAWRRSSSMATSSPTTPCPAHRTSTRPGLPTSRATRRCSSGRASCSTRWRVCVKTRSRRARSASTIRPSSRRTPES